MRKKGKKKPIELASGDYPFPLGTDAYFNFLKKCIHLDPLVFLKKFVPLRCEK